MLNTLFTGLGHTDAAILLLQVATGLFFAISGYHKLFNTERHCALRSTLKADHIPFVPFNEWFVPLVELLAGSCLVLGLFTVSASIVLLVLLSVALYTDGRHRVADMHPIDRADWLDDWLYLCETTYVLLLLLFIAHGPRSWSLDTYLGAWLQNFLA